MLYSHILHQMECILHQPPKPRNILATQSCEVQADHFFLEYSARLFCFAGGKQETQEEPAAKPTPAAVEPAAAKEAPVLAELVKAGTLPPLEQRLPEEPLVLEPVDGIGKYGGTLQRIYKAPSDGLAFGRLIYDPLIRFSLDICQE